MTSGPAGWHIDCSRVEGEAIVGACGKLCPPKGIQRHSKSIKQTKKYGVKNNVSTLESGLGGGEERL